MHFPAIDFLALVLTSHEKCEQLGLSNKKMAKVKCSEELRRRRKGNLFLRRLFAKPFSQTLSSVRVTTRIKKKHYDHFLI